MRICILASSYQRAVETYRHELAFDPRPWLLDHECHYHLLEKSTAASETRRLAGQGFDVFINLCDGYPEEEAAGVEVVRELERCGVAFTGPDSAGYEPSREDMKRACRAAGIASPNYRFADGADDGDGERRAADELRFPLIVKHPRSYDSIGLERGSRVAARDALRAQVSRMTRTFGGALIEEFIEGREFTVLCAEPREGERDPLVYAPVELRFPPGETFKHFDLKWSSYDRMAPVPVDDAELAVRLRDVTGRMFTAMKATSYARCDVRMDADGEIFMLDFNEVPCIFLPAEEQASADLILARDPGGRADFLAHIIDCARRRRLGSPR